MSQRRRTPGRAGLDPATRRPAAGAAGGRPTGAATRTRGRNRSRRTVTFAIVVVGMLIATWVLVASLGFGTEASPSQPSSQAVDTKAAEATIAGLQERLRQNPSDVSAMVSLGDTYYDLSRWAEAIPWYEKALQSIPANTDVRTDLGTAYLYSGNTEKAKEHWFKVLEQDPNKVQTHYNLAVLYSHLTPPDTEAAAREWETVIRLAPGSDQARSAEKNLQNLGKR